MLDNKRAGNEEQRAPNYNMKKHFKIGAGVEVQAHVPLFIVKKSPIIESLAVPISQIVDYIFFSLYALLALRLLLALFTENSINGFVQLVKNIADPFYVSFNGLFPILTKELGLTVILPIIMAIFVYMFLYLIINGLLTFLVNRKTTG